MAAAASPTAAPSRHASQHRRHQSVLAGAEFDVDPDADKEARAHVRDDIESAAAAGFVALARYGLHANLNPTFLDVGRRGSKSGTDAAHDAAVGSPQQQQHSPGAGARSRWLKGVNKAEGSIAARKLREAARLKALQRTPYPMVLARLKLLLERLAVLLEQEQASGPQPRGGPHRSSTVLRTASFTVPSPGAKDHPALMQRSPSRRSAAECSSPSMVPRAGSPVDLLASELPPLERVREELAITFAYVSDFLRKVPEETRVASINYARMENYKKDQTVYMMGDEPTKFYMILTGAVEVWAHPVGEPRKRTVLASLKRGQSFGEKDILNNEPRTECVTPTSNCTFLVLDAEPFKGVFSDHFEQLLARAQDFFMHHVHMFRKVPVEDGHAIVRHMLLSSYPAGKDWEPLSEQQVYFIKSGSANLESHDKRNMQSVVITRSMLGLNQEAADSSLASPETLPVAEAGVLSNVVMREGRAVGTLGHEEEIRRLKRLLIPKKVIATLGVGSFFGGGPAAMGAGELQGSLRVMATSEVEAYHCHMQVLRKHASPALLSALRDDVAFKLTYCYGRMDMLGPEPVVGHPDALLAACLNRPKDREPGVRDDLVECARHAAASSSSLLLHPDANTEGSAPAAAAATTGASGKPQPSPASPAKPARRKKPQKLAHEPGRYNPEVEKALAYIASLQAHSRAVQAGTVDSTAHTGGKLASEAAEGVLPVPGYMSYLVSEGVTPAERFWSVPALCANSARTAALAPLLKQVYPEGLAPLADKVDQLIERTQRAAAQAGMTLESPLLRADAHSHHPRHHHRLNHGVADQQDSAAASPKGGAGCLTGSSSRHGGAGAAQPQLTWCQASRGGLAGTGTVFGGQPSQLPASPRARPVTAPTCGALISAGLVWERGQEVARAPALRQVLTYEEIARLRHT